MSSTLAPATAPAAERRVKPRSGVLRRFLTLASVLIALVVGTIGGTGTAFAQVPPGSCPASCGITAPQGVSETVWRDTVQAANFWANSNIDFFQVIWSGGRSYYDLDHTPGRGWPGAGHGRNWYAYQSGTGNQFIYYGGTFHDYNGDITFFETQVMHVSAAQAYSTYTDRWGIRHNSPYVEYDMDSYPAARTARNARRIIRNVNTGHTFVTYDHYTSFYYIAQL